MQLLGDQNTPLMRQYLEIKGQSQDAILLFRLGDFYEMFFEDAVKASKVLDIALTSRDKNAANPIPLCGVPHHSSKGYIAKLLDAGHKVAICEQVEETGATKGIVRREIVKVITPGTRSDEEGLESSKSSFILSMFFKNNSYALSWLDVSSGTIESTSIQSIQEAKNFILTLAPSEIIISDDPTTEKIFSFLKTEPTFARFSVSLVFPWTYDHAEKEMPKRFGVAHLASMGMEDIAGGAETIAGLLYYVEEKNKTKLPHLQIPKRYLSHEYANIDYVTQENLELFESRRPSANYATLFSVLNHTMTGMGARELRSRIQLPLQDLNRIQHRLSLLDEFTQDTSLRMDARAYLKTVTDIERILRRLALRTSTIMDLVSLRSTLKQVPNIKNLLSQKQNPIFKDLIELLNPHATLYKLLDAAIDDAPGYNLAEGGFIRDGYHQELDRVRSLSSDNQTWLANLEAQERKRTGISSLKISYNRVFGYYIEITKVHHDKVPADYIRKQTLVSAERYITPELKEKEHEIQTAKERMVAFEHEILQSIRNEVAAHVTTLTQLASGLAQVDVLASLAHASIQWAYVRPVLNNGFAIEIKNGRHPVVERNFADGSFVPNDLSLNENARMILLTGPNMAGKSTVMRQAALIVIMAQMGCYVPADSATIGIVDRIFTRIGASDDLAGGRSTFMVEMNETAQILLNATDRSLILLDEIGRGTSTYDGLSIAWAVAEDIDQRIKAKTIFATHYHELTKLSQDHKHICTMRMGIREWKDQIIFLRKVEEGVTERSYGIEVAQLAGVRPTVISRAKEILKDLENQSAATVHQPKKSEKATPISHPLLSEIEKLNVNDLSPKQALDLLFDLKQRVKN